MVPLNGDISNQVFETLAEWEEALKETQRNALDACLHGSKLTGTSKAQAKLKDPFPV